MSVPYDKVVCMELIQVAALRDFSQFTELDTILPVSNHRPSIPKKAGREILSRTDAKASPCLVEC